MSTRLRSLLLALLILAGCLSLAACVRHPFMWVHDLPKKSLSETTSVQPGDRITVLVKNQPQLSGEFEVRANGGYLQPLVGEVMVAGLSPDDAVTQLTERLQGIVVSPAVTVSVSSPRTLLITVLGEVRTPGSYPVPLGDGVIGALARAGGLTEFASDSGIYVLRKKPKRSRIRFRYSDLSGGEDRSSAFKLRDGDVVIVE